MKITKKILKRIIKEELEEKKREITVDNPDAGEDDMTDYELADLSTDEQMIMLLRDILAQLKVLNLELTPSKTQTGSSIEKDTAAAVVAEKERK
tara:strand:- start:254 stop:535 length:282 start_codon:yes stop_codon:yes gene_type:complete